MEQGDSDESTQPEEDTVKDETQEGEENCDRYGEEVTGDLEKVTSGSGESASSWPVSSRLPEGGVPESSGRSYRLYRGVADASASHDGTR